ncbi:MAG TPA: hypothetical protein VF881_01155 [Polyangiaceae bacterium]
MSDWRELGREEGKAWASRLHKQLETWNRPANDDFPGRIEEAVILASRLTGDSLMQRSLAEIIQVEAQAAWWRLKRHSE